MKFEKLSLSKYTNFIEMVNSKNKNNNILCNECTCTYVHAKPRGVRVPRVGSITHFEPNQGI